MLTNKETGQLIRTARMNVGMSQMALVGKMRELGTPWPAVQSTLSRIEAGSRNLRLSEAVTLGEIFPGLLPALLGQREIDETANRNRDALRKIVALVNSLDLEKDSK